MLVTVLFAGELHPQSPAASILKSASALAGSNDIIEKAFTISTPISRKALTLIAGECKNDDNFNLISYNIVFYKYL